jgi:S1-C subfamily serine protease
MSIKKSLTITVAAVGLLWAGSSILPANETYADRIEHEERVMQAAERTMNSTVKVTAKAFSGEETFSTGFFVRKDEVLVNWDSVKRASGNIQLAFQNGRSCSGSVGYREEGHNLAIVKATCEGEALPIASKARVAETVILVGNPKDFDFSVTRGSLSRIKGSTLEVDARVNAKSTGAPVVNANGEVVGVMSTDPKGLDYVGSALGFSDVGQFVQRSKIQ